MVAKFDDTTGFLFTGSQKSDVDQEPATSSVSSAFPKETVSGGTDEMFPDVDDSVPKLKKKEKKASKPEKQAKLDKKKVKKHQKKKAAKLAGRSHTRRKSSQTVMCKHKGKRPGTCQSSHIHLLPGVLYMYICRTTCYKIMVSFRRGSHMTGRSPKL